MEKTHHAYREQLLDSIEETAWDTYRKSRKQFGVNPQSLKTSRLRFSQLQLESPSICNSFQAQSGVKAFWNPRRSIREAAALPLFLFSEDPVICPTCGHVDIVCHGSPPPKVVRLASQALISKYKKVKGTSILDRTDDYKPISIAPSSWNRRWKCKRCGRTFRWGVDKDLKFPFELWGIVLSCFLEGDDLKRINKEVTKAAKRMGIKVSSLSSEAVYNIVKRFYLIMGYFEPIAIRKFADREVKLGTVQLDYTPYTLYTSGSRMKQLDLKSQLENSVKEN